MSQIDATDRHPAPTLQRRVQVYPGGGNEVPSLIKLPGIRSALSEARTTRYLPVRKATGYGLPGAKGQPLQANWALWCQAVPAQVLKNPVPLLPGGCSYDLEAIARAAEVPRMDEVSSNGRWQLRHLCRLPKANRAAPEGIRQCQTDR